MSVRVLCRSVRAFLLAQLIVPGVFCSVNEAPLSAAATTDTPHSAEVRSSGASLSALSGLLNLRSNSLYSSALPALEQAVLFIQDPGHIVTDATKLFALLLQHFYETDPVLGHLTQVTATGRFKYNVMRKMAGPTEKSEGKSKQSPVLHHKDVEIGSSEDGSLEAKEFVNGRRFVETDNQFENEDDDTGEESPKRSKEYVLNKSSGRQDFKSNDEVSIRLKKDAIDERMNSSHGGRMVSKNNFKSETLINNDQESNTKFNHFNVDGSSASFSRLSTDSFNNGDEQLQENDDRSALTTAWASEHQDRVSPSAPPL